jgi:D-3-phosphoglycerate dehydrogenase
MTQFLVGTPPLDDVFSAKSLPKPPIPKERNRSYKILLLENIDKIAVDKFVNEGFQVEALKETLDEEQLKEKIRDVVAIGIRSRTQITEAVIKEAKSLLCIGCFCIGTNQVDLKAAAKVGIPVFNSPFCNSRSVAELIIAQIINLARHLGDKNMQMHQGIWEKSSKGCHEVRGKTLGIVGYGHIGSQLSVLAEAMGMNVIFYDIVNVMPLGNSTPMPDLDSLLRKADFVTLHVPETPETKNMIGKRQLQLMKKGSYLLNASRGSVVVISDLVEALRTGHLAGAYIDVYPVEPPANTTEWKSDLQGMKNVLLTPHIGGSTEEAQLAIGDEVSDKIITYINTGRTMSAVNFPQIDLPYGGPGSHRILNVHKNKPGVLKEINNILSIYNVESQVLRTMETIGYMIADVDNTASEEIKAKIDQLPASIRTRILY